MNAVIQNNAIVNTGIGIKVTGNRSHNVIIDDNTIFPRIHGIDLIDNTSNFAIGWGGEITNNIIQFSYQDPISGEVIDTGNPLTSTGININGSLMTGIGGGWKVEDNYIYLSSAFSGIRMNAERYTKIRHNTIEAANGVDYNGIGLNGCSNVFLLCNVITANTNSALSFGIVNNTTANSALYCNYIEDTEVGIQHSGGVTNFNLYGNEVSNNDAGLRVGSPNSTSGNFFGVQPYHGNIWDTEFYLNTANTNNLGAVNFSTSPIDLESSLFTYRAGTNPRFRPIVQLQPGIDESTWFESGFANTTYSCNDTTPTCEGEPGADINENLLGSGTKDLLDTLIVRSALQTGICPHEIAWNTKRQLYAKFSQAQALNLYTGTLADSFMLAGQTESFGILTDFEREVGQYLNSSDSILFSQIQANRANSKLLSNSLRTLNTNLSIALTNNQPTQSIQLQLNSIITQQKQVDSLSRILVSQHEANVQQYYTNKINELSNYSFAEVPAVLLQQINLIYLKWLKNGSPAFTTTQASTIFKIADNCARCSGDGVFFARSLYRLINSEYRFDDDITCSKAENREYEDNSTIRSLKVYPNPVQSQLTIEFPLSNSIGTLRIVNYLGRTVFNTKINNTSNKMLINTSNLSNGYYQILVKTSRGDIFNTSFIIQK